MPAISIATVAIYIPVSGSGGNRSTGNITLDANVNDLIIGLSGSFGAGGGVDYPDEVWWGTEGVAQQLSTEALIEAGLSNAEWVRLFRLRRPSPGTYAVWTTVDTGVLSAMVVWQIRGGIVSTTDTGATTTSFNDLINVSLSPVQNGGWNFYIGHSQSGVGGETWTNLNTGGQQTSSVFSTVGAWEPASAPDDASTYGSAGNDGRRVAVGAAYKSAPGGQVIIVQ